MTRTSIGPQVFICPMPLTLVGTVASGMANFMAVGWVTRVNANPPMVAVAINQKHLSNEAIRATGQFSINVPTAAMVAEADYCGIVSGRNADKSRVFDTFSGELENAPMIEQCPLCMECEVDEIIELPTNTVFIARIVTAYADEACLTDGNPDIRKIDPLVFTMPDNTYFRIGDEAGRAWGEGRTYQGGQQDEGHRHQR